MASILALEYATSGFGGLESFRVATEGYAMLKCISRDISLKHSVTVMVSNEIQDIYPIEADRVLLIRRYENPYIILKKIASQFNHIVTIAPAQKLPEIVKIVEKAGGRILGPCLETIRTCSNKYLLYRALKGRGIPTPKTSRLSFKLWRIKTGGFKPPFVVKPVNGVGCIGISLVNNVNDIEKAVTKARSSTLKNYFMIQEFIDGINASACIVGDGVNIKILSINLQYIDLKNPYGESSYNGGLIPIRLNGNISNTLMEVVRTLKCLYGFTGIDFIISNNTPYITDVNPRITTSYIGLRKIINVNIPDMIIGRNVNVDVRCDGYSIIKKMKANRRIRVKTLDEFVGKDNIFINPAAALSGIKRGEEIALIIANNATVEKAERDIEKLKLEVENYFSSKGFIRT
jgi:predicted ATP-grasp superfamily ATP-dependent carboligase